MKLAAIVASAAAVGTLARAADPVMRNGDWRNIVNGALMLASEYLDQPYCVVSTSKAYQGEWLCLITQDSEHEGGAGEHVLALRSADEGRTWSSPVALEPSSPLTNAYSAVVQEESTGRVIAVYNMNLHNVTHLPDGTKLGRTDELGVFRARYSDDNGRTWSEAWELPLPQTAIDANNSFHGAVQIFWNVDVFRTWALPGQGWPAAGFFFTKIGKYAQDPPEELFVLSSADLLRPGGDPALATWSLGPNTTSGGGAASWRGVEPPNGNPTICEEPHLLPLQGGGFWAEARTTQGFLAAAATADAGLASSGWPERAGFARFWVPTAAGADDDASVAVAEAAASAGWAQAVPAAVAAAGAAGLASTGVVKQPRGPTQLRRLRPTLSNGSAVDVVALLFYFNSETGFSGGSRNPYWLTLGTPRTGADGRPEVVFAQPEVVMYDRLAADDRPGYPDMLVRASDGALVITETNKTVARTHAVDPALLQWLVLQRTERQEVTYGMAARLGSSAPGRPGASVALPALGRFAPFNASAAAGDGLTVELGLSRHGLAKEGDVIVDSRAGPGAAGIVVRVAAAGALSLIVTDGANGRLNATMDTLCAARLAAPGPGVHSAGAVADSAARIAMWVVDGVLCDGALGARGWQWFNADPADDPVSSGPAGQVAVAPSYGGSVAGGRVYGRALLVSELVSNFRAGF